MPTRTRLAALGAAVVATLALPAHAGDEIEFNGWAVVGSVGVINDGDVGKVSLNDRTATF